MKETHKKLYGFLGLGLVAAMTFCAAVMPSPEAQAAQSTVTDVIQVRVVNAVPDVVIDGIVNDEVTFAPVTNFSVEYYNVGTVQVLLTYTDLDGNENQYVIDSLSPDYADGSKNYTINALDYIGVSATGDGFGSYTITVRGEGHEGAWDSEVVTFKYLPINASATEGDDKNVELDIDTNANEPTVPPEDRAVKAIIKVTNKGTGEEAPFSPITVDLPLTGPVVLPFGDYDMPTGDYLIEVTPYNANNEQVGRPFSFTIHYDDGKVTPVPEPGGGSGTIVPVPDTGGLFQGGNISSSDYIITGLIVLAIVGIGGAAYIIRHDKKKAAVKVRRRK